MPGLCSTISLLTRDTRILLTITCSLVVSMQGGDVNKMSMRGKEWKGDNDVDGTAEALGIETRRLEFSRVYSTRV
jgi:hypothetical protein